MDFTATRKSQIKKYYLGPHYPHIHLSYRQAQCMAYSIRGFSNREIGSRLHLSANTIHSYTKTLRIKLGCGSKTELIVKVCQSNFVHHVDELIDNNPVCLKSLRETTCLSYDILT